MEIKEIEPQLDNDGNIIPKQKCCGTCKKRLHCQLFSNTMSENNCGNEYAEFVLGLYYICDDYVSMFIQYPIEVNSIISDSSSNLSDKYVGRYVLVSLNVKNYDDKPHLGLYLGELPVSIISLYDSNNLEIKNKFMTNPAILVLKFNKIFYGMSCRWQFIEHLKDLEIIDQDDPSDYLSIAKNNLKN